jgi:uncharacterized protein YkwD
MTAALSHLIARRPARAAAVLAAAFALAAPAGASALTLHVLNQSGVPQPAMVSTPMVYENPTVQDYGQTDIWGRATNVDAYPGMQITVTRDVSGMAPGDRCAPPEGPYGAMTGPAGVVYTVPNPVPADATVVLPNVTAPAAGEQAAADASDEYLIGLINQLRAKLGLQPVTRSTVLTVSARRYVHYLTVRGITTPATDDQAHCSESAPWFRAEDVGWPNTKVPEIEAYGDATAKDAFTWWVNSPGHYGIMTDPTMNAIGVGFEAEQWIVDFGNCQTNDLGQDDTPRCGLTTDQGTLTPPPSQGENNGGGNNDGRGTTTAQSPHLTASLSHRGRNVTVLVRVAPGARGRVSVSATGGKTRAKVRGRGGRYSFTAKRGRWTVRVSFAGQTGWKSQTVTRTIRIS